MPQMAKQAIPFCLYAMAAWPNGVSEVFGRESNSSSIYSLPRSEPESKPEYETVVAGCFSQLTRIAGRVAILPAMGKLIHNKRGPLVAMCVTGYVAGLSFLNVLAHSQREHHWLLDLDWLRLLSS